ETPVMGDVSTNDDFPAGSTFAGVTAPLTGPWVFNADGTFDYTPAMDFTGVVTFTYEVCLPAPNGTVCDLATVTIVVGPEANDDNYTTPYETPVTANVNVNDEYPANSTFNQLTQPTNGTVVFSSNGSFTYTPNPGFTGTDSYTYEVCLPAPNGSVCDPATVTILVPQNPDISITKTGIWNDSNNDGNADVGETISYTFVVENTGNVTLTNVTVTDPLVTIVGGPIATFAPGEIDNTTFTGTYILTQADIDAGQFENIATATGTDPNGDPVTDQSDDPQDPTNVDPDNDGDPDDPTVTDLPQAGSIALEKTGVWNDANNDGNADVGETITYTFNVTNTGNVTLTNITVTDPLVTVVGGPLATLAPGASNNTTFTGTYVLTQADINAGEVVNLATTTGSTPSGGTVSDNSDDPQDPTNVDPNLDGNPDDPTVTLLPQTPDISLTKTGTFQDQNGDGYAQVGETITYAFTVTNTGNVTLTNVTVSDPLISISGGPIAVFAPGAVDNTTFTGTLVLTQAHINAGEIENIATATGIDPNGVPTSDQSDDPQDPTDVDPDNDGDPDDPTLTLLPQNPQIALTKRVSSGPTLLLDNRYSVTFEVKAFNLGNVTLSNLSIMEDLATTFAAAASWELISATSTDFNLNAAYSGMGGNTELLGAGNSLDPGAMGTVYVTVYIAPGTTSDYLNTAVGSGDAPNGNTVTDSSDDGIDPDSNDDNDGTDLDENDPTPISLPCFVEIICPSVVSPLMADNDLGWCNAVVNFGPAVAVTCAGAPDPVIEYQLSGAGAVGVQNGVWIAGQPSGLQYLVGTTTVRIHAISIVGTSSECVFDIIVLDKEAPVAVCQDITITLDANGNASIDPADIDGGSSDNCGILILTIDESTFDCTETGDNNVTLTVSDGTNESTCVATVTVKDEIAPVLSCPATLTAVCSASEKPVYQTYASFISAGGTGNDNCGVNALSFILESETDNGLSCPKTLTRVYRADDNSGNSATCSQTVVVDDQILPTLVCPGPLTAVCSVNEQPVYDNFIEFTSAGGVGSDNCGLNEGSFGMVSQSQIGNVYTRTYRIFDNCDNMGQCTQTVTVVDNVLPVITYCPSNLTLNNDVDLCSAVATWSPATATDNCGAVTVTQTTGPASGSTVNVGSPVTITYKATDASGNMATCSFTVSVVDEQLPTISCAGSGDFVDVFTNQGNCSHTVNNNALNASVTDNCPGVTMVNNYTGTSSLNGAVFPIGNTNVIWTATDAAGNVTTCLSRIRVIDNDEPTVATCPANINQATNQGDCEATVIYALPTFNDNCDGNGLSGTLIAGLVSGSSFPVGVTTVTYQYVDNANNGPATCSFTVTVTDDQDPEIFCPPNLVLNNDVDQCGAVATWVPATATDNCGAATVTQIGGSAPGTTVAVGSPITITYQASDLGGNTVTCSFTISVVDVQTPTAVCQDITIDLDANGDATIVAADVDGGSTDNCPANLTLAISDNAFDCNNVGDNNVTLTVTDGNNNVSTCVATVTVEDNIAPTFTCPADITLASCNDAIPD
ncbi:MAG: HYR domain-containing protein, partial [Saprospiraceae bacterium]|nr:HYR domain-containing protein [Saprospiraceae bacterium]